MNGYIDFKRHRTLSTALVIASLALASSVSLSGCASGPEEINVPLQAPLGQATLSVQVIGKEAFGDPFKKRQEYAAWMQKLTTDALSARGFSVEGEEADRHLVVELTYLSTGALSKTAECRVTARLYGAYPGDQLERQWEASRPHGSKQAPLPEELLSFSVRQKERSAANATRHETTLGKKATQGCIAQVTDYLASLR